MTRPLACLDVETTGICPINDRIVQVGIVILDTPASTSRPVLDLTLNPQRYIPADATRVHGITNEAVAGRPTFADVAPQIHAALTGCDFVGYNLRRLDLPILDEELRRCGLSLPLDAAIIDCYGIFAKKHPRRLEDAYRLYVGGEMDGAHNAYLDALATAEVLRGQRCEHADLAEMSAADLARFSNLGDHDYADLAGKLYRDGDGDLRYAFGKPKDVKVRDDLGFAAWMLDRATFPGNTRDVLEAELDRLDKNAADEPAAGNETKLLF